MLKLTILGQKNGNIIKISLGSHEKHKTLLPRNTKNCKQPIVLFRKYVNYC